MRAAWIASVLALCLAGALAPARALAQDPGTDDPAAGQDYADEPDEPAPPPTYSAPRPGGPRLTTSAGGPLPDPWQTWVNESLMPAPPIPIVVYTDNCDEFGASCIDWANGQTTIRVAPDTDLVSRYEFLHEIGHAFDWWYLDRTRRARFTRLLGMRGGWWKGSSPPGERFAMAYSLCAMNDRVPTSDVYSGYDYAPRTGAHVAACRMIRQDARCGPRARSARRAAPRQAPRCARARSRV